jgi:cob(I)alamin adenosyltransferase
MAVHLTRIYTKTGDDGTTGLGDFSRTKKHSSRVEAYAGADETNSSIGVAIAFGELSNELNEILSQIQNDLFDVGADLCAPIVENPEYPPLRVTEAYVERLEGWCDEYNENLRKLDSFILPGGTKGAALLNVARVEARSAERRVWQLLEDEPQTTSVLPAKYLNRLSDLLFILGRVANPEGDVLWKPGGNA